MDWFESAKEVLERWKAQEKQFTPRVMSALSLARKEADQLHHNYLGTEHLLLGLIALGTGTAVNILNNLGLDLQNIRSEVEKRVVKGPVEKSSGNIPYTSRMKSVLKMAVEEAKKLSHAYIGTEHLLLGLMREDQGVAAQVLKNLNIDLVRVRTEIVKLKPTFVPGFTPRTTQSLAYARKEADRLHHNYLGTEHLLLGLIALGTGTAVNILNNLGLDPKNIRSEVEKLAGMGPEGKIVGDIPYTPQMRRVLEMAAEEAKKLSHAYIGTEHLLLGLLTEKDGIAADVFKNLKIDTEEVRKAILKELAPNLPPDEGSKD